MQLNNPMDASRYRFPRALKSEIPMTELSEQVASDYTESAATGEVQASQLNQNAVEFMIGAQRLMFEEFVFYTDEMLERTQTEMKLFTEFAAKMAAAHSVRDVKTMYRECGQHQLDFLRRDSARLFKHGERIIATTSHLISGDPLN
jgi:hypothetical protein